MTQLIPISEVAARVGVSRSTIERLLSRGEFIAAYQLPTGTLRFDTHELDLWLANCKRTNAFPKDEPQETTPTFNEEKKP